MDENGIGGIIGPIIGIVVIMALNFLFRGRKAEKGPMEMVMALLSDIRHNERIVDSFRFNSQPKKFKTGSWKRNQAKLSFLDQELQTTLSQAFGIAEEFNKDVDAARKYKSASYLANVNVSRLSKPLADSKRGLEEWLQANTGKQDMLPRRRGLFG